MQINKYFYNLLLNSLLTKIAKGAQIQTKLIYIFVSITK